MQNDTSREGTSTNNICFAPSAIPKRLQQNGALQLASDKHVPLVLQGMAERAEQRGKARMESALELLLSLGSELLGQDPSSPSTFFQQTNHHTGTAPQIHLSQHPDTDIAHVYSPLQQGIFQGKTEEVSQTEWAFPRHRLEFEAIHSWDLSRSRLCKQTVAFDCHWLFLSLFSHFLKSLT